MLDPTPSGLHTGKTPLLQTVGLTKRYGTFLANESIDIDIWPQQIHALLGENGAGKSTLVKAMYGLIQPSDGEMRWQGEKMTLSGPSEARARGIGMVFQHFFPVRQSHRRRERRIGSRRQGIVQGHVPRGWRRCPMFTGFRSIPDARFGSCRSVSVSASKSSGR